MTEEFIWVLTGRRRKEAEAEERTTKIATITTAERAPNPCFDSTYKVTLVPIPQGE